VILGDVTFMQARRDQADTLERALTVAWLKHRAMRSELGLVGELGDKALLLPFSPGRLASIADAQSVDARRRERDNGADQ